VLSSLAYLVVCRLFELTVLCCRSPGSKELEILVLRHELSILRRHAKRPQLQEADRVLLAAWSRALPRRAWTAFSVSPRTLLRWHHDATAFSHRDANYLFHPISVWQDPADDERLIATNRAFADAMRPFGTGGAYLNFTPEADRVRDAYGDEKYERLVALKDKYDPDNVFRMNQNITPSKQADELALA
jgi:FAD/FMN-containing dehydrogenase